MRDFVILIHTESREHSDHGVGRGGGCGEIAVDICIYTRTCQSIPVYIYAFFVHTYIYIIHIYMQTDHGAMLSMCVCAHSEHKSENQALTFSVLFDRDSNT